MRANTEACRPLLRLPRRPFDELDYLPGDAITENFARIVGGVFDGDVDTPYALIVDRAIDEFVRDALWGDVALTRVNLGYTDVLASLDWIRHDEDSANKDDGAWSLDRVRRRVGRNDPCPCASGGKAKKCGLSGGYPPA